MPLSEGAQGKTFHSFLKGLEGHIQEAKGNPINSYQLISVWEFFSKSQLNKK